MKKLVINSEQSGTRETAVYHDDECKLMVFIHALFPKAHIVLTGPLYAHFQTSEAQSISQNKANTLENYLQMKFQHLFTSHFYSKIVIN